MKSIWTKAALGAAAIFSVGAVQAAVIDFENVDTSSWFFAPQLIPGDFLTQGSYLVGAFDGTGNPDPSLVGALMNPNDPSRPCLDGVCPGGDNTQFYATLNTGAVALVADHPITLMSFQAALLQPAGGLPTGAFGLLAVQAIKADGSVAIGAYALPGAGTGNTSFATYNVANATYGLFDGTSGTLTSGTVMELDFFEFYCSSSSLGTCGLDNSNRGQFALDNITTAVPETSSWALMGLGLAALGTVARRRRQSV